MFYKKILMRETGGKYQSSVWEGQEYNMEELPNLPRSSWTFVCYFLLPARLIGCTLNVWSSGVLNALSIINALERSLLSLKQMSIIYDMKKLIQIPTSSPVHTAYLSVLHQL